MTTKPKTKSKLGGNCIGFFSDLHLRSQGSFSPFNRIEENGLSRELNNIIQGLEFVADKVRATKPRAVFLTGDIYHTPEGLDTQTIHGSAIGLGYVRDACQELGIPFYIMPGNHDMLNDKLGIMSISTLCGYGEVVTDDRFIDIEGYTVGVVQFNSDKEKVAEALERAAEKADLIVTHLDFKGARYETGKLSGSQISPNLKVPVISGDIHLPQEVGAVNYIGSLVQNRFNRTDLSGVGGYLLWDVDKREPTRYPNTYSKHYVKIEKKSQLKDLDPEHVVLQVRCPIPDEKTNALFAPYDYIHLPMPEEVHEVEVGTKKISMDRPEDVLRAYVKEHRPTAIDIFDSIMGVVT